MDDSHKHCDLWLTLVMKEMLVLLEVILISFPPKLIFQLNSMSFY